MSDNSLFDRDQSCFAGFSADTPAPQSFAALDEYQQRAQNRAIDLEIFEAFPEFKQYINSHPYTTVDSISLKYKYEDNWAVAENEIRVELIRSGRQLTEQDKAFLIHARAVELALASAEWDDAIDFAERSAIGQAYRSDMNDSKLTALHDAVNRSATGANMLDTAKQHPFLTGFFGSMFLDKLFKA